MAEDRKRKSVYERYEKKRKASEERNKTRVVLGDSFTRWRELKAQVGLPTDASVAKFLLNSYDKMTSTPVTNTQWARPQPPAVSTIQESLSDREADFSVKGVDKVASSHSSEEDRTAPREDANYEKNPSASKLSKRRLKRPPPQHVSTIVSESLIDRDHNPTDEEEASDAPVNHKDHSNSSSGSSFGNTEHLHIKEEQVEFWENQVGNQLCGQQQSDIIAVIVKSEDDGGKPVTPLTEVNVKEEPETCSSADVIKKEPVTLLTEVNIKEEPQTCSSADVIKKEEHEDNDEQQTETS